jgi:hypothetical protein
MLQWQIVDAIASAVSATAIAAGAIFVIIQLRQAARDRYLTITSQLFEVWQSPDFQEDQLFLIHKLPAASWEDFVKLGRGDRAERALHRVGGFYDRVGNLIRQKLIKQDDILPTIAGHAIAVWHRIEPLVLEARRRENALLFQNYEAVLPNCRECYVPLPSMSPATEAGEVERIEPAEARRLIDQGAAVVLDVSKEQDREKIGGALRAQPNDLAGWLAVVQPGKSVVTYCT